VVPRGNPGAIGARWGTLAALMVAVRGLPRVAKVVLPGLLALGLVVGGFGPLVRVLVRGAAERRGVEIEIGHVWPAWPGVRLLGAVARPIGVQGVEARIDEARILFGPTLRVDRVVVRGGTLQATGSRAAIEGELAAWRRPPAGSAPAGHGGVALQFDGLTLRWVDGDPSSPLLEVLGIEGARDAQGARVAARLTSARLRGAEFSLADAWAELDGAGALKRAHAASLLVEWDRRRGPRLRSGVNDEPGQEPTAPTPLLELPDLRSARSLADALTAALTRNVPAGADVGVDAVVWKITPRDSSPLTFGPGPLTIAHGTSGMTVDFAAGASPGATSLSVRASLPLGGGDSTLEVLGGPASLAQLGLRDGTTGLFDVAHATITGRARLALAADASALDFDLAWAGRGLSLRETRIASEPIRGLDVQLRASGTLAARGTLRFDELTATIGALRLETSGVLDQESDHFAAAFRFSVPTAPCQTLLSSVPTALLPVVQAMRFAGTFGAEGRVVFDSRSLDDLELEYDVRDRCRPEEVAPLLAREALTRPFLHRVYLPDGSTREEETGPGTATWTPLDRISPFVEVAVTTTEDGAFRRHHGYSQPAIRASLVANLKARRFVRGASTITMQLAKNLFLSREKTLSRKLEEVILTDYLEQVFSKDEILELYLNVVEFGPAVYGMAAAAEYYFARAPAELNLAESFFLTSVLPAPLRYAAMRDAGEVPDGWMRTLHSLMRVARRRGLISDEELAEGLREPLEFWRGAERPAPRPAVPGRLHPGAATTNSPAEPDGDDAESP
jgi:hypothetical protein